MTHLQLWFVLLILNNDAWALKHNLSFKRSLDDIIKKNIQKISRLEITLVVLEIPILVILAFYSFMISKLKIDFENNEIAIIKSRGGSSILVFCTYLIESSIIGIISIIIGPFIGLYFCRVLGSPNGFLEFVQRGALPIQLNVSTYGEQQRIAISIGVVNHPKILLADEPTGSVDARSSNMILDIFRELNKTLGITIIIVTHDRQFSKKVDRVVSIRDGRTSSEFIRAKSYTEELADSLNSQIDETHVELAVLDKSGRLQIPKEYIELLGMTGKNKIRVETEGNRVILLNPDNVLYPF